MKIPNTNIDMELWAEVEVLLAGLEEYDVDTDEYRDRELEKLLESELNKIPKSEQDELEETLRSHVLKVFIEKYAQLKHQYYGE